MIERPIHNAEVANYTPTRERNICEDGDVWRHSAQGNPRRECVGDPPVEQVWSHRWENQHYASSVAWRAEVQPSKPSLQMSHVKQPKPHYWNYDCVLMYFGICVLIYLYVSMFFQILVRKSMEYGCSKKKPK